MPNPIILKLELAGCLNEEDRRALNHLCNTTRKIAAQTDIIHQDDPPADVHLILDGIAYRYKLLPNGKRQIVGILIPGDLCDVHVAILGRMDHSIATLTHCTVVNIPAATIKDLTNNHPRIAHALWWATLVDEGTLRQWLANLGQRDAVERAAHFFCEFLLRLQSVGLADENSYHMPFRQNDLADLWGLSTVHVNRTLQELRRDGLIALKNRNIKIPDVERLKSFCAFDPSYLHLGIRQRTMSA